MDRLNQCSGYESGIGMSRRSFYQRFGAGLGAVALSELMKSPASAADAIPHFAPKAKRVIYLFQSGGPSQMDTLDHKPLLKKLQGQELPDEIRRGQRLTAMSGNQASLPLAGSPFEFKQYGDSGHWISSVMPHLATVADELAIINSVHTEAINHGPGVTYLQTGSQFPGRPSMGAWLQYGLGAENENLPAFVVLVTKGKGGQPLVSRLWGSGFLPSKYQGVRFRSGGEPVLYLNNPAGLDADSRARMLAKLKELHELELEREGDPEIESRIAQYELARRMQQSIPEATNTADEPAEVFDLYGKDSKNPGSYAANCLLARRLAERGVRFIQLYHQGWDQHGGIESGLKRQCGETDQPTAALIKDLRRRGLLDDTLVVWGGEFGRTNYCQGKFVRNFGRDHHPRCFSVFFAGGGVKAGVRFGKSDDYCYNIAENGVHIHDLQATILHLLGIDHLRLTFKHQGRWYRLTDVRGKVIDGIVS
ncbi:MAG: DUF1501 domain-containing protein [Pirellulaceae bacterium]|jgi:uncharacterized protein (DUF1501 family)|nr:DUF1501 domain-containing protein [Pirellulaceae bacterium]MDP7015816.1 DUF1501 domain-containing protein [Pirellulaceae bacterium]